MGILGWIVLGFAVGVIVKAIVPGGEKLGIILTTALGIGGAVAGGFIATALGAGDPIDEFFDLSTWIGAIAGGVVVLFAYSALKKRT